MIYIKPLIIVIKSEAPHHTFQAIRVYVRIAPFRIKEPT